MDIYEACAVADPSCQNAINDKGLCYVCDCGGYDFSIIRQSVVELREWYNREDPSDQRTIRVAAKNNLWAWYWHDRDSLHEQFPLFFKFLSLVFAVVISTAFVESSFSRLVAAGASVLQYFLMHSGVRFMQ